MFSFKGDGDLITFLLGERKGGVEKALPHSPGSAIGNGADGLHVS
jgi:hypothetical protein